MFTSSAFEYGTVVKGSETNQKASPSVGVRSRDPSDAFKSRVVKTSPLGRFKSNNPPCGIDSSSEVNPPCDTTDCAGNTGSTMINTVTCFSDTRVSVVGLCKGRRLTVVGTAYKQGMSVLIKPIFIFEDGSSMLTAEFNKTHNASSITSSDVEQYTRQIFMEYSKTR
jgi:hypothetical protein